MPKKVPLESNCTEAVQAADSREASLPNESLVPKRRAMAIVGMEAPSSFYAAIAAGLIPPPVKFGRKSLWLNSELQAAIEAAKRRRMSRAASERLPPPDDRESEMPHP